MLITNQYRRLAFSAIAGALIGLVGLGVFILLANIRLDSEFFSRLPMALTYTVLPSSLGGFLLFGVAPIALTQLQKFFEDRFQHSALPSIGKSFITFILCLPLLFVCIVGDIRDDVAKHIYESFSSPFEILFLLAVLTPVICIQITSRFPTFQNWIFTFFLLIVATEIVEGIIPTSQLNHEGSDLLWTLIHLGYSAFGIAAYVAAISVKMLFRLTRTSNS